MDKNLRQETLDIENEFDVIVIGTSITNSLLSAGLSKIGQRTLIIEPTSEFGSSNASPSLTSLKTLLKSNNYSDHSYKLKSTPIEISENEYKPFVSIKHLPFNILYTKFSPYNSEFKNTILDITPSPLLIKSTLLSFIISSRLHNYMNFNCISNIYTLKTKDNKIYSIFNIPFDSESLIENKSLPRLQKYKLSKLISGNIENIKKSDISILAPFIKTKQELKNFISSTKIYNIKNNSSNFNSLLNSTNTNDLERTATPFIYPSFGLSEIPQGILRMTSLSQGTVICNVKLESILKKTILKSNNNIGEGFNYIVEANGASIKAKQIVISAAHIDELFNNKTDKRCNSDNRDNKKDKKNKIEYRLNFACSNIEVDSTNNNFKYTKNALEVFYIEKDSNDGFISDIFMIAVSSNTERIKPNNILFQVCCNLNTNNENKLNNTELETIDKTIRERVTTFLCLEESDLLFINSFVYVMNENHFNESKLKEIENKGMFIVDNYSEVTNNEKLEEEMEKINDIFVKITGKTTNLFDVIKDENKNEECLKEELNRLSF